MVGAVPGTETSPWLRLRLVGEALGAGHAAPVFARRRLAVAPHRQGDTDPVATVAQGEGAGGFDVGRQGEGVEVPGRHRARLRIEHGQPLPCPPIGASGGVPAGGPRVGPQGLAGRDGWRCLNRWNPAARRKQEAAQEARQGKPVTDDEGPVARTGRVYRRSVRPRLRCEPRLRLAIGGGVPPSPHSRLTFSGQRTLLAAVAEEQARRPGELHTAPHPRHVGLVG